MSAELMNTVPEPEQSEAFVMNLAEEEPVPEQLTMSSVTGDPVRDYLRAIGKTPLLNAELEVQLSKTIEAGLFSEQLLAQRRQKSLQKSELGETAAKFASATDEELEWLVAAGQDAKRQMQEANLRLVVSIAKKYMGRGTEFLDLIQEGNQGLAHAVEKFDFAKGFKFSTYSTWWIRQAITRAMADKSRTIRLPVHMVEKITQMERVEKQMEVDLGREPTPEELAQRLEIDTEKIIEYKRYARHTVSLDTPLGDGGGAGRGHHESYLKDLIEDTTIRPVSEVVEFSQLQKALQQVLGTFSEREAGVIDMRFGLTDGQPRTLDEVGKVYGVTRERIRQIESKTMAKLRHPSRSGQLREFLS